MAESPVQSDNQVYIIEKILKHRVRGGKMEYLIKWQNYAHKYNTWEPAENVLCQETLKSYEDELNKNSRTVASKNKMVAEKSAPAEEPPTQSVEKLEPDKIIGASFHNGNLMYLLKWKNDEADLVSAVQARVKCPQLVIKYFQEHSSWVKK